MEIKYCCDEMKNHNEIGIYLLEWGYGWELNYDGLTLHYCPFCGKKIEFIDKSDLGHTGDQNSPLPISTGDNPLYRDSAGTEELHENTR